MYANLSVEDALGHLEAWLTAPGEVHETYAWLGRLSGKDYQIYRDLISTQAQMPSEAIDAEVARVRGGGQKPQPQMGGWGHGSPGQAHPPNGPAWGQPSPGGWGQNPYPGSEGHQSANGPPPGGRVAGRQGHPMGLQTPQAPGAPAGGYGPAPGQATHQQNNYYPSTYRQDQYPARYPCPHCKSQDGHYLKTVIPGKAWVIFAIMMLICGPILAWIPLVTMKEKKPHCSRCHSRILG